MISVASPSSQSDGDQRPFASSLRLSREPHAARVTVAQVGMGGGIGGKEE